MVLPDALAHDKQEEINSCINNINYYQMPDNLAHDKQGDPITKIVNSGILI